MAADGEQDIEKANLEFYRALESGSLERMEEVWSHEEFVRCVHPGWSLIAGWKRVMDSWRMIFEGGQKLRVSPSDIWVHRVDHLAWVTCTENITVFSEDSFESAQTTATNLFVLADGRWRMIYHHASTVPVIVPDTSSDTIQ